jgi:hypothetical protein
MKCIGVFVDLKCNEMYLCTYVSEMKWYEMHLIPQKMYHFCYLSYINFGSMYHVYER